MLSQVLRRVFQTQYVGPRGYQRNRCVPISSSSYAAVPQYSLELLCRDLPLTVTVQSSRIGRQEVWKRSGLLNCIRTSHGLWADVWFSPAFEFLAGTIMSDLKASKGMCKSSGQPGTPQETRDSTMASLDVLNMTRRAVTHFPRRAAKGITWVSTLVSTSGRLQSKLPPKKTMVNQVPSSGSPYSYRPAVVIRTCQPAADK